MAAGSRTAARSTLAAVMLILVGAAYLAGRASGPGPSAAAVVPGPYRSVDGLTLGFAHSEAGADAAAAHYLLEIERAMDSLSPRRTDAVAALLATPAEAQAIKAHAASVIALEQARGAPLRRVAVSTALLGYSALTAQVLVLESWIYATNAQEALWAIERVSLAWREDGWRVSAVMGGAPSADESLSELRAQLSYPGVGDASVR